MLLLLLLRRRRPLSPSPFGLTSPEGRQVDPDFTDGGYTDGLGAIREALGALVDVLVGSLDGLVVEGSVALTRTQGFDARAVGHHPFMVRVAVVAFVAGVVGVTHILGLHRSDERRKPPN